jgi:upstream activation factor subunit UAF30
VKAVKLSPELSDIIGTESMPRPEVVKKMWSIIKERNLYVSVLAFNNS